MALVNSLQRCKHVREQDDARRVSDDNITIYWSDNMQVESNGRIQQQTCSRKAHKRKQIENIWNQSATTDALTMHIDEWRGRSRCQSIHSAKNIAETPSMQYPLHKAQPSFFLVTEIWGVVARVPREKDQSESKRLRLCSSNDMTFAELLHMLKSMVADDEIRAVFDERNPSRGSPHS